MTKPTDFLPVKSTVFLILMSVAERPMHGYAITRDVHRRSDGTVDLGTSHLYRHLKRLLEDRLVQETEPEVQDDDPRRRYYALTDLGREVVRAESNRLKALLKESKRLGFVR